MESLRIKYREWENAFEKRHKRLPNKQDIYKDPKARLKLNNTLESIYKQFRTARLKAKQKAELQNRDDKNKTKNKNNDNNDNNDNNNNDNDNDNDNDKNNDKLTGSTFLSPVKIKRTIIIEPTPQKGGTIISLFDPLNVTPKYDSTPKSKSKSNKSNTFLNNSDSINNENGNDKNKNKKTFQQTPTKNSKFDKYFEMENDLTIDSDFSEDDEVFLQFKPPCAPKDLSKQLIQAASLKLNVKSPIRCILQDLKDTADLDSV